MKILNLNEWVNEGLWSKTLNRGRTGERRLEDNNPLDRVCELVSQMISEKSKIPFDKGICTCEDIRKNIAGVNNGSYVIRFKFKKYDFTMNISQPEEETFEHICISFATTLSIGVSFYKNIPRSVKNMLTDISDELMKIVKSNISEGLWSKTLNRGRTGEVRLEDKIQTNINTMEVVDIGHPVYVFADKDLEVNGEDMFNYDKYLEFKDYVNSKDWEIPGIWELTSRFVLDKLDYEVVEHDNDTYTINGTSNKTGETLSFTVDDRYRYMRYMCEVDKKYKTNDYIKSTCMGSWEISKEHKFNIFATSSKKTSYKIRLVRRKRND